MDQNYIPRSLYHGDRIISEAALLAEEALIVVLAEPGAGKSDLLTSMAAHLGGEFCTATSFRHRSVIAEVPSLVIDALDEVARIDQSAIDQIIVKAKESQAGIVVLACRSSEWDPARTRLLQQCFGSEPAVVRLLPFSEAEQKLLFEAYLPGEDFTAFLNEAARFELVPLLGNPQFLKLFSDAYVQSGRKFVTKSRIFVDAVERLTSERSASPKQRGRPPSDAIIRVGEELFAKLLLSGSTGLSSVEQPGDMDFPYLRAVSTADLSLLQSTLDTRLFKPSATPARHEPVHRIVSEYCAARYLATRIDDATDPLSLGRCLAVIAPNSVVRDELRGMLGWMAAVGSPHIQRACIDVDPYAVLANGDPSQLTSSSKHLLMTRLRELSKIDPYFRRSDSWRRFSVAGLFSVDMVDDLKEQLTGDKVAPELRDLLLELLQASDAIPHLEEELCCIMLDADNQLSSRMRAQHLLTELPDRDRGPDVTTLIAMGDTASLRIATDITELGMKVIGREQVLALLQRIAATGKVRKRRDQAAPELRFYVRQFISTFDLPGTEWLLDELTRGLTCTCGATREHRCNCRIEVSKIAGSLLDQYFKLSTKTHAPDKIWGWTKSLTFDRTKSSDQSIAVQALTENDELRQAIHRLAFAGCADDKDVWDVRMRLSMSQRHSGLQMNLRDYRALLDHAFETGNAALWGGFYSMHNIYSEKKGPDDFRALMRRQGRERSELLRIWSKRERETRSLIDKDRYRWPRSNRRWQRKEDQTKLARLAFFRENLARIEAGAHWGALRLIADYYLLQPEKMGEIFDDVRSAARALLNSFPLLDEHVPTLSALSQQRKAVTRVLHAACLAYFRGSGTLERIDRKVLAAVKTDLGGYGGYGEGEGKALQAEIDRLLFGDLSDVEAYAREFIEPQLTQPGDPPTDVGWLRHKQAFKPLQKTLALEWLERFPEMPKGARDTLFDICAEHADRSRLRHLIEQQCAAWTGREATTDDEKSDQKFWFLRALFFLEDPPGAVWEALKADPQTITRLEHRAGRFYRDDAVGWPVLSAKKVFAILDAYVDVWPKVFLPSSWGTGDPPGETAYRFLSDVVHLIGRDSPDQSLPVLDKLLSDDRFADFHRDARSMKAAAHRKQALQDFRTPSAKDIVNFLDHSKIATVEDLRALLVEELVEYQRWVQGAETDPLNMFYPGGEHLDENSSRDRIVDRLQVKMSALNLSVTIEHHMAHANRCDITASVIIDGRRRLLVIEVKGQWHSKLFSAASAQLHDRYSVHPDAADQGIYLVLWFGAGEKIAGRKDLSITTTAQLKDAIIEQMPVDLRRVIDVVILDLSRRPCGSGDATGVRSDPLAKKVRKKRGTPAHILRNARTEFVWFI
ncbi:hypothetical protein [Mesorhizobium sp. M0909]|uniref:hypothetical protein n=1 Tax=Mesorhizobium sp. M0909 TaxID=2957024 RepID=UPI00333D3F9F